MMLFAFFMIFIIIIKCFLYFKSNLSLLVKILIICSILEISFLCLSIFYIAFRNVAPLNAGYSSLFKSSTNFLTPVSDFLGYFEKNFEYKKIPRRTRD